ncbi:MAG: sugar phosphate isomerase/epimerase [Verrucomicrobia bacterium]|nr:sugar phosphate isomerase/epimerase [Verrucomicrobiota bacterium]
MKSAITVSLVPETAGGPFVFTSGLADAAARAATFGFDALEVFPRSAAELDRAGLARILTHHRLQLAALGTGAGWVVRKLTLTHVDPAIRRDAREFIRALIDAAAEFGAPAIIGSMQGRVEAPVAREQALAWFADALADLGAHAASRGTVLLYEPLNRYETNLFNRQADAAAWLRSIGAPAVRVLCDLFHMNIEEPDLAPALREVGPLVGHVHFADSNRRAIGLGHTVVPPVIAALRSLNYAGYLSAEVIPLPDADTAARETIASFRRFTAAP